MSCKSITTNTLHYLDWVQPSNQSTCLHRQHHHLVPYGWTDRTLSTSLHSRAPFANSASPLQYPLLHYLITLLSFFEPTSLLRSQTQTIWEEITLFVPRSFRNCINRQALSRRLNNIHRKIYCACVLDFLLFYDEHVGLGT